MSKISQGEWLQMSSSEHKRAIYAHGTGFICFLPNAATDGLTGEFQANQDLIAAAPELLSSAEAVWKNAFAGFTSPEEKKKLISDLAAAVSKARGFNNLSEGESIMDTNNNFYNLLFSDPNVSSDYKDALAAGFIPPYKKPDPAADPPQSDVSPLDPGNQLIMYADIAKNWFNEFKEKFPAQYEFLFDNMIQPFPIEKLTDAVAAAVDQRIAQNKTAHLWCHAKDKEQLMDALMHIRDCFWSDGESDAERIAYLQEYVKIRLSEFEDNPNAKK